MAKTKSIFVCQNCSYQSPKWLGQCPDCGEWNTFVESIVKSSPKGTSFGSKGGLARSGSASGVQYLSNVKKKAIKRSEIGISEFDRVVGGGLVNGQVILLAGEPGIGKSTLLTQISKSVQKSLKKDVCYVGGEESLEQIKLRTERMQYDAKNLIVLSDTDVDLIADTLVGIVEGGGSELGLIIVDSIQTLTSQALTGVAGSVGQVRLCSQTLSRVAKKLSVPMILVGHVTKEGTVAGPKVLEHMVDTVLYLEGDSQHMFRILKTSKNRFGPVSEVGIFEMNDTGISEVKNPSKMLLGEVGQKVSGSCVTVVMEGYRPLLFEIQALTTPTSFGYPKRTTSGFSVNRLQLLIAILQKRCGIKFSNHDVYLNVAGGFKVNEYAADLAVCLALASSIKDKPLKMGTIAFGECGLLGEVRNVSNTKNRAKEARKLGYNNIISPGSVKHVYQAINMAFEKPRGRPKKAKS